MNSHINLFMWLAFIVLFWGIWYSRYVHQNQKKQKQLLGIKLIKQLRRLLSNVQKHRGLSAGFINGDMTLELRIIQLQNQISQDILSVNNLHNRLSNNERWQGVTEHWQRLAKGIKQRNSQENLNQHQWLIQNTLYLIEDIADEFSLLLIQTKNKINAEFLWKDLLQTIEFMGQTRALGTGVAAAKHCNSVERIKLNYLHKKIDENCEKVLPKFEHTHNCRNHVELLLHNVDNKILVNHCALSPQQFFETATNALESLYSLFDEEMEQLNDQLERKQQTQKKLSKQNKKQGHAQPGNIALSSK